MSQGKDGAFYKNSYKLVLSFLDGAFCQTNRATTFQAFDLVDFEKVQRVHRMLVIFQKSAKGRGHKPKLHKTKEKKTKEIQ